MEEARSFGPLLMVVTLAAAIAKKLGVIDEAVNAAVILVAVATVTAAPLAFVRIFPAARRNVECAAVSHSTVAEL